MIARFGITKQTLLTMIQFFPLSFLKRRRSRRNYNYRRRQWESWFVCELTFWGNSTGCIGVETFFCVNRWHSNRIYTINQGTEKRRDTNPKLLTWTTGILVCLELIFLWKFDGVYRRWNVFCVNRWHSNRIYTINQGTEKRRDTNPKVLTWTTGILIFLELIFCGNSTGCIGVETYFA